MKAVFEKVIVRFDNSNFVIDREYHHVRYVGIQSRASLVPAAAVTPAGRVTDNFVAVETFVVACFVSDALCILIQCCFDLRRNETL